MLRLYVDEDAMSNALAATLRARGIDVSTVTEAGMRARDDADQLAVATLAGRVIFSHNVGDFMRLHGEYMRTDRHHAGIVLAP